MPVETEKYEDPDDFTLIDVMAGELAKIAEEKQIPLIVMIGRPGTNMTVTHDSAVTGRASSNYTPIVQKFHEVFQDVYKGELYQ